MISSGFKKLAAEYGMTVKGGVAYGSLRGFSATFSDGMSCKYVTFSTKFPDPQGFQRVDQALRAKDLEGEFIIQDLRVEPNSIVIQFFDTVGTLKRIRAFLDWFIPVLQAGGATTSQVCAHCGMPLASADPWKRMGITAHHMHPACADALQQQNLPIQAGQAEAPGSYFSGFIGALMGSAAGAAIWAVVLCLGYVAGICGFVIGWCAKGGYELLKGRQGKGKPFIVLGCALLGVVVGCIGGDFLSVILMIQKGELPLSISEASGYYVELFGNADYTAALTKNLIMGILFAILGLINIFRDLLQESGERNSSMKDLT